MATRIVSHSGTILLVGGGPVAPGALAAALGPGDVLVACDGGVSHVIAEGLTDRLVAVIGDMDSLPEGVGGLPLYAVTEQDSTDFDKALRHLSADLILGLGFWGGRADHSVAVLGGLVAQAHSPCILTAGEDILFAAPPELRMELEAGTRVSLWPLLPSRGSSTGLHWPIDGLDLRPEGRIGTSNRASGGPVTIRFAAPGALVILPGALSAQAAAALRAARRWPAPPR